jgi:RNA polymerase sigma-70 factor, ECF subfamily
MRLPILETTQVLCRYHPAVMGDEVVAEVDVEVRLTKLLQSEALDAAATLAFETYGPELYGFLVNLMGGASDAAEVFSQATEDLWRALPSFGGRCSVRTWMYLLARHAAARYWRSPWNRGGRTGDSRLDALVAEARSRTGPWLQTEVKDRWKALRESLEPDDRALLVLRVDRDLSWGDVARVMLESEDPGVAELARETTRLRKRFQLLKEELRKRAREAGLIREDP